MSIPKPAAAELDLLQTLWPLGAATTTWPKRPTEAI